jgi:hypothetical protein
MIAPRGRVRLLLKELAMTRPKHPAPLAILVLCLCTCAVQAQNPVQWNASVQQSVERANEQSLPLLFWVSDGDDDDDDLKDAQEDCFRDPVVVNLIQRYFIPVRVSRTSNVIQEAQKLGLPTSHGLYCAVLTPDARLLDQMGPDDVADPAGFTSQLVKAYTAHCADLYEKELRPIFDDPEATKSRLRLAAQTVWRLGIRQADSDVIALLDRTDLTPSERSRIYSLLASLGTESSIDALLDRSDDQAAADSLRHASPGGIEWLMPAMPGDAGDVTPSQLLAYRSVVSVCRLGSARPDNWWAEASTDDRRGEVVRVSSNAEAVLGYWRQSEGITR